MLYVLKLMYHNGLTLQPLAIVPSLVNYFMFGFTTVEVANKIKVLK